MFTLQKENAAVIPNPHEEFGEDCVRAVDITKVCTKHETIPHRAILSYHQSEDGKKWIVARFIATNPSDRARNREVEFHVTQYGQLDTTGRYDTASVEYEQLVGIVRNNLRFELQDNIPEAWVA